VASFHDPPTSKTSNFEGVNIQEWSVSAGVGGSPVLVVDDEEEMRGELREALAIQGLEVIEAANGREALDLLTSGRLPQPCLIVLDLRMPVMTGWEFLAILRSYHRLSRIPVIVLSGVSDGYADTHPPAVSRLSMPLSADLLLKTVQELITTGT
jgi:CheY-like chemotaxis protein